MTERRLLEHAEYLRRLARGLVLDPARADDIVQETYLRALSTPPRHSQNLRGWLATVARNVAFRLQRDASRRTRREERAGRPDREPSASDVAARTEAQKRIAEAVNELEEPYRTVVVHRYFDGLTPSQIAMRLAVSVKTVKTRLHRALERLRARLDRDYGDRSRWSLLVLPLALPRNGAAMAAGVTVVTMKKIVAALLVLGVLALWTASRVGSRDSGTPGSRAASAHRAQSSAVGTERPARAMDSPVAASDQETVGFVFAGRVVDAAGMGVPDADVHLLYWGSPEGEPYPWGGDKLLRRDQERAEAPRASTDAEGYFKLARPYASRSFLRVNATGFGSTIAGPFEPRANLRVVVDCEREFEVTVHDPEGRPVADALVRMMPVVAQNSYDSRTPLAQGRTDPAGRISLPHLGAEQIVLEVAPRQPDLGFVDLAVAGQSDATITVPRLKTRTHTIVDALTGRPIPDAYAIVSWSGSGSRSVAEERERRRIEADSSGVVRFPLQEDYYGHLVTAPGYEVSSLDRDIVPLQRSMTVQGDVVDARGDPVAGAAILIASSQGPAARCFAGLPLVAALSDTEGQFEVEIKLLWPVEGVPDPGVRSLFAVSARHGCAIADAVAVRPGTRAGLTLRFPKPARLTVEIVGSDGTPRPDHWINVRRRIPVANTWNEVKLPTAYGTNAPWLLGQRPVTDGEGRAVIEGLPPGTYDLDLTFHAREVIIEEGVDQLLRIVRGGGPSVFGRVLDESGEPLGKIQVAIQGTTSAFAVTDAEGRFLFEDVMPGDHRVAFHSRQANAWISVPAPTDEELVLREPHDITRLRVRIEGPAPEDAEFCFLTSKGSGFPPVGFWSCADPIPESATFAPSKGIVIARAPGYSWTVVPFDAPSGAPTEVLVRLSKSGAVKGSVDADVLGKSRHVYLYLARVDGEPQRWVKDDQNLASGLAARLGGDGRISARLDAGQFEIPDIAPGVYWATLYRYDDRSWEELAPPRKVEVRSGQESELTFRR